MHLLRGAQCPSTAYETRISSLPAFRSGISIPESGGPDVHTRAKIPPLRRPRANRPTSKLLRRTLLGPETDAALDAAFSRLGDGAPAQPTALAVQGRALDLAAAGGIARSTFEALCGQALGAADYIEVARQFHTLVLAGVPLLGPERNDQARRFINLIDVLYEHRVNLLCGAEAPPARLYDGARPPAAFGRTVSRLEEMQSEAYLAAPHLG